jgi:hypothetical protein
MSQKEISLLVHASVQSGKARSRVFKEKPFRSYKSLSSPKRGSSNFLGIIGWGREKQKYQRESRSLCFFFFFF